MSVSDRRKPPPTPSPTWKLKENRGTPRTTTSPACPPRPPLLHGMIGFFRDPLDRVERAKPSRRRRVWEITGASPAGRAAHFWSFRSEPLDPNPTATFYFILKSNRYTDSAPCQRRVAHSQRRVAHSQRHVGST